MEIAEAVRLTADFLPSYLTERRAAADSPTDLNVALKRVHANEDGVSLVVAFAIDGAMDGAAVGALGDLINGGLRTLHKQHPELSKFRFEISVGAPDEAP